MCINKIGKISLYQSDVLSQFEKLIHGFTTRGGGVSEGAYESLSLSPMRGDNIECVRRNEEILCTELSLDIEKLSLTRQEHTDIVKIIDEEHIGYGVKTPWESGVDGCITMHKNVPLICYSADCVPILLYAKDIGAIGAVHAGWRGTQKKIIYKAVQKLIELGADPHSIYAAIGPCIGQCCYEVSGDVALQFDSKYYIAKKDEKFMLDLAKVNYDIIKSCDVIKEHISLSGICTKCNNDLFFSHRAQNGKSGTLGAIICMRD